MLTTTETLLEGLAAGNETRWARFYRDYAPFLEDFLAQRCSALSHADTEEVVSDTMIDVAKMMPTYQYDKAKKGAFHSLLMKIAQNKAFDRLKKLNRAASELEKFAAQPLAISSEDWRREIFNAALRRVMVDSSIQESTKIAFRRHVQLGESAAKVAADLGLDVNALYQIKNRIKERIAAEVENLKSEFPDGL